MTVYEDLVTGIVWLIAGVLILVHCRGIVDYQMQYLMKQQEWLARFGFPRGSERVDRILGSFVLRTVSIGLIVFGILLIYQFFSGDKIVQ